MYDKILKIYLLNGESYTFDIFESIAPRTHIVNDITMPSVIHEMIMVKEDCYMLKKDGVCYAFPRSAVACLTLEDVESDNHD